MPTDNFFSLDSATLDRLTPTDSSSIGPFGGGKNLTIEEGRTFTGLDMTAWVSLPGRQSYRLGTLSMLSISTHRDKFPVSRLGRIRPMGFTAGHRTIGGTMVFATIDRSVWHSMMGESRGKGLLKFPNDLDRSSPDDLPPFDLHITFVNESGHISYTNILGVTLLDEGETYGIDNPEVMETFSYMALERTPLQAIEFQRPKNTNVTSAVRPGFTSLIPSSSGSGAPTITSCVNVTLSSYTANVDASAGSTVFTINSGDNNTWSVTSDASWLTLSSAGSGQGAAGLSYSWAANTGSARTGHLLVCDQLFTLNQATPVAVPCAGTISPASFITDAGSGMNSFRFTTTGSCPWTATSSNSWLHVLNASGNGTADINFSWDINTGATRFATITASGLVFNVTQAAVPAVGSNIASIIFSWYDAGPDGSQRPDLDTGVTFDGTTLGYQQSGGGSSYLTWNGDNVAANASESFTVAADTSRADSVWSNSVTLPLKASWYGPNQPDSGSLAPWSYHITASLNGQNQTLDLTTQQLNGLSAPATNHVADMTILYNSVTGIYSFTLTPVMAPPSTPMMLPRFVTTTTK